MKYLGEVALSQGLSQEGLAKALGERFSVRINGANVSAHFASENPRHETIERYAHVLGFTTEQLHVIERGALSPDRLRHWEREVLSEFALEKTDFRAGVIKAVKDALRRDSVARTRALTAAAWSWNSMRSVPGWATVPHTLQTFAAALFPCLDLREFVRKKSPGEGILFSIYADARSLYGEERKDKVLAFVDACAAILRLDGFDTRPMYDDLRDNLESVRIRSTTASRKKGLPS